MELTWLPSPERCRELRHAHGMTIGAVASLLGVSEHAVSKWERGKAIPSGHNYARYSGLIAMLTRSARETSETGLPSPQRRTFLRKRAGMTQSEMACRVGTAQGVISKWENGLASPKGEQLTRYLDVLVQVENMDPTPCCKHELP
jgi:transcriptional regulator with XRE-family HTH domain